MSRECMLTTFDNPFDPFEQFSSWLSFDNEKDHYCCERVDRIATISDSMSEEEVNAEIERAIDSIIEHDFLNIYKKVVQETPEPGE